MPNSKANVLFVLYFYIDIQVQGFDFFIFIAVVILGGCVGGRAEAGRAL